MDIDSENPVTLKRQFGPTGPAGPDEAVLMEEYRRIAQNPAYDPLIRARCYTRYRMLQDQTKRQPPGWS